MVERAPDQRALNFKYAQVLTKLGRGNEAKQYLERAVAVDPTFGAGRHAAPRHLSAGKRVAERRRRCCSR